MTKFNLTNLKSIPVFALGFAMGAGCWFFFPSRPVKKPLESQTEVVTLPEDAPPDEVDPPGVLLSYPTPQTRLDDAKDPTVFMPTASGRVVSAAYGSTRTRKFGNQYLAAFHEGVDIAPMKRDATGRARDPVFAVAQGRIAYINRRAGASSYGIYVVLLHDDPIGKIYTLYAHLASVPEALAVGDPVTNGAQIGQMGHSSTLGIPIQRSHLHFEFGTMLNSRFDKWLRSNEMTLTHGLMHGWNLAGLNPRELFPAMKEATPFVFELCILETPVALRLIIKADKRPDYYSRYPSLWIGEDPEDSIVLDVSESGVPLRGRAATAEEDNVLAGKHAQVLEVFPETLGRNGKRLVVSKGSRWIPGPNLSRWLEILLYR